MAFENLANPVSVLASTGLRQYRGVAMGVSASGKVGYPAASTIGQSILGVINDAGTTGSTKAGQYVSMAWGGVVKMEAEASTLHAGSWISCSTLGRAQTTTNVGDAVVGKVIAGSSGAANRILSVLLLPVGSTVTPA